MLMGTDKSAGKDAKQKKWEEHVRAKRIAIPEGMEKVVKESGMLVKRNSHGQPI